MSQICRHHGITRQAYYKHKAQHGSAHEQYADHQRLLQAIDKERRAQPMVGGVKLLEHLRTRFGSPIMGRDRFFDYLRENDLLIHRKQRYCITTNSHHRFYIYENQLPELSALTKSNEVFVSDITYLRIREGLDQRFVYLALVSDLYSRKIVGYDLSWSLSTDGALRALRMALKQVPDPTTLMHHSDRGIQYCSAAYIDALHGATVSMAQAGNPYENAVAERINGILKQEFCLDQAFPNFNVASKAVAQAIATYNNKRLHRSLNFQTPAAVYADGLAA